MRNVGDLDACRELLVRAHRVILDLNAEVAKQAVALTTLRDANSKMAGRDHGKYAVVPLEATNDMVASGMLVTAATIGDTSERRILRARYSAMVSRERLSAYGIVYGEIKDRGDSPEPARRRAS